MGWRSVSCLRVLSLAFAVFPGRYKTTYFANKNSEEMEMEMEMFMAMAMVTARAGVVFVVPTFLEAPRIRATLAMAK
jgi:hypothetical protein